MAHWKTSVLERLPDHVRELISWDYLIQAALCAYYPKTFLEDISTDVDASGGFSFTQMLLIQFSIFIFLYSISSNYSITDAELVQYVSGFYESSSTRSGKLESEQDECQRESKRDGMDGDAGMDQDLSSGQRDRPSSLPLHMDATDLTQGLSDEEALKRRAHFGSNQISLQSSWTSLVRQVIPTTSHLSILGAIILALTTRAHEHSVYLFILFILSVRRPLKQYREVGKVIDSLAWDPDESAIVLRDRTVREVTVRELVPGDMIHVSEGQRVPADGRVVVLDDLLELDQSAITGTSEPVSKDLVDICYATTVILRGNAFLLVEATGMSTFIGRTAATVWGVKSSPRPSRQVGAPDHILEHKKALSGLGLLMLLCIITILLSCRTANLSILLRVTLSFTIAADRSGSRDLHTHRAVGAANLAKGGCIVQQLESIDALAGIDVLCSDKTGSITHNWLSLYEPYSAFGDVDQLMTVAYLSSAPGARDSDPIDAAIARALKRYPRAKGDITQYRVLDHEEFNPDSKVTRCCVETLDGDRILCVKGSPKGVLKLCSGDYSESSEAVLEYKNAAAGFARRGCRTLGVACKHDNGRWKLLGLLSMYDAPRDDVGPSLRVAKRLGLSVRMVTGDAIIIAKNVSEAIALEGSAVVCEKFGGVWEADRQQAKIIIAEAVAYAECFPENKQQIVEALQEQGHAVAMTGDGKSDGISLRQADCGIAVEGSTEFAQACADVVMLRSGLPHMVKAIRTSRQVFQQAHNSIVEITTRNLCGIMLVAYFLQKTGQVLPVALTFAVRAALNDLIRACWQPFDDNIPYCLKPVRWNFRRLIFEIVALLTGLLCGAWLAVAGPGTELGAHAEQDERTILGASQHELKNSLLMYLAVSECWLLLIVNSRGRPSLCKHELKQTVVLVSLQGLGTVASVLGFFGRDQHLSVNMAMRVWITSFFSAVTCMMMLRATSSEGHVETMADMGDE